MSIRISNETRGELALEFAGQAYTLLPSFSAMCRIESRLGLGWLQLVDRVKAGALRVTDMAAILQETALEGGTAITAPVIHRMAREDMGLMADAATQVIIASFAPPKGDKGEAGNAAPAAT